ncbi:hypothetical protein Mucpa_1380 [Mucilaginibacter paludis DSM 18603]|uniref:Uncharacterized protein n=2 Tax=Mucilaginibacter TaxID=423349 RepID=H1YHZ2_9SPHI|nr:hypothetical protein Mucpa_1380 [Mucilaginibacter paludis DSM 18603]
MAAAFLVSGHCMAQVKADQSYHQFVNSFPWIVSYPMELVRKCIPVNCLIKVRVDSAKNVVDMQLSDSADSLIVAEFEGKKHELSINLLEKYIKAKYSGSTCTIFLIPFTYTLLQMRCTPPGTTFSALSGYAKFNNKPQQGEVIFLDPIYVQRSYQR